MSTEIKLHSSADRNYTLSSEEVRGVVANIATEFADVAERQDVIGDQLVGLASRHDLSEAIQDPVKSIILVGLASKLATAYDQGDDSYAKQNNFSDIAAGLLRGEIQPYERVIDDNVIINVFAEYRNAALSRELDECIKDGLLDEVKQRMGVTPENEAPYQVHVLDIASPGTLNGVEVSDDINSPQFASWRNEAIQDYRMGLVLRYWEFRHWLKGEAPEADAWVVHYGDATHLFVVNPTAEKLLNPEVTANSPHYDDMARQEERALLEHEYVHTQNQVCLDDSYVFGIGLEELRAEHFSGNFPGCYEDTKGFFRNLHALSGVDIPKQFDSHPMGGTTEGVLRYMAKRIGVESAVDVLMVPPEAYCDSKVMQFIYDSLGGYNGVLQSIVMKEFKNAGEETLKHSFSAEGKESAYASRIGQYATASAGDTIVD